MTQAKPVPLIKYVAAAKWRPVPLFVDLAVEGGSGSIGGEGGENGNGGGEGGGPAGLRAVVQTNSQLKSTLQNVLVTVTPPDGYGIIHSENGDENQNALLKPEGSTWDEASRKLLWRVSKELVRETPVTCTAGLLISDASSSNGNGKDGSSSSEAELAAAFQSVPFHVQFGCEGVTISGIELEVQLSGGGSGAPPIAKLMRRFTAGEYRVTLPRLTDVSGGLASGERRLSNAERRESDDAEQRRDSKED